MSSHSNMASILLHRVYVYRRGVTVKKKLYPCKIELKIPKDPTPLHEALDLTLDRAEEIYKVQL